MIGNTEMKMTDSGGMLFDFYIDPARRGVTIVAAWFACSHLSGGDVAGATLSHASDDR